jgi:hypothetical protein
MFEYEIDEDGDEIVDDKHRLMQSKSKSLYKKGGWKEVRIRVYGHGMF